MKTFFLFTSTFCNISKQTSFFPNSILADVSFSSCPVNVSCLCLFESMSRFQVGESKMRSLTRMIYCILPPSVAYHPHAPHHPSRSCRLSSSILNSSFSACWLMQYSIRHNVARSLQPLLLTHCTYHHLCYACIYFDNHLHCAL